VLDLAAASVFVDFDGTITAVDSAHHLLDRFAPGTWQEIDAEYARGEIGSRVCLLEEWDLLPRDEALLRSAAREVPIDQALAPLVESLRAAGAEVTVVSDGFGFLAREVCEPLGLAVLTNDVDWSTGDLRFPHEDRCCPCSTCGMCKQAPMKDARHRGRVPVLVGDGTSDRKAALLADVVLAKGALARWCAANDVAYTPFDSLADVQAALVP
jgi:2-hydroxy-3-keto-5-methylthiopentenyl-1-phosphate phosphatase